MRQKFYLIILFFAICSTGYTQKSSDPINISEPFHIQVKAFQNGKNVFNLNTRENKVSLYNPKSKKDTSISLEWNDETKKIFFAYLSKKKTVSEMKEASIPKPSNIEAVEKLLYFSIQRGDETTDFWIKPEIKKNDSGSAKAAEFIRNVMKIFERPSVKKIK